MEISNYNSIIVIYIIVSLLTLVSAILQIWHAKKLIFSTSKMYYIVTLLQSIGWVITSAFGGYMLYLQYK